MALPDRYDTEDFRRTLKGDPVRMNTHEADALAEGLGQIAAELRQNHTTVKGALHQIDDRLDRLEKGQSVLAGRMDRTERVLAAAFPDAFRRTAAERYEVRQDSGGLWIAWRVVGPRERYVSSDPCGKADAEEHARVQLRRGQGGTLAVYDEDGELDREESVEEEAGRGVW